MALRVFVLIALLELIAIVCLIAFRDRACAAIGFAPAGAVIPIGAGGGGGSKSDQGSGTQPSLPPPASAAPVSTASASGGGSGGDATTQGDVDQVPDPKCVGTTTAGLLNSSPAPAATASCAPMSPPPALKNAENQVSGGTPAP